MVVLVPGLKAQRERMALTQEQLSKRAGVRRATISRAEQGHDIQVTTVRKLANALDCPARQLVDAES